MENHKKSLLEQKEFFAESILENAQVIVLLLDRGGKIIRYNPFLEQISGIPLSEAKGKDWFETFIPQKQQDEIRQIFAETTTDSETITNINPILTHDGKLLDIEWHDKRVEDKDGNVIGVFSIGLEITKALQEKKDLINSEQHYRFIAENMIDTVWTMDMNLRFTYISPSIFHMRGYTPEEAMHHSIDETLSPESVKIALEAFADNTDLAMDSSTKGMVRPIIRELEMTKKDGSYIWAEIQMNFMTDENDLPIGIIGVTRDITKRKQVQAALLESKARYQTLFEKAHDAIFIETADERIVEVNNRACEMTGYTKKELLQMHTSDLEAPERQELPPRKIYSNPETDEEKTFELELLHKNGTHIPVEISITPLIEDDQSIFFSIVRDITERKESEKALKESEEKLQQLAYYDVLTGLPNRALFQDRLQQALFQSGRSYKQLALLFLDLDNFKNINDTLGHRAGDRLLQEMGVRLQKIIRRSDTISRLGGDEFTIILTNIEDPSKVTAIAQKILDNLAKPFIIDGHEIFVTASMGITMTPLESNDPETMIKNADLAMYKAKEHGKNNYQFFSQSLNDAIVERMDLEAKIRSAIDQDDFQLHYQPRVDILTGDIIGMEALLRWDNEKWGSMCPEKVIPLAVETGQIVTIGEWSLRTACTQAKKWQEMGLDSFTLAVNLSSRQFEEPDLVQKVGQALERSGLNPKHLELEITEETVMTDPQESIKTLYRLKSKGIRIAVDDFGTGYSSMNYLKRFPIDTLKIDQSFVTNVPGGKDDSIIVELIITLAKSLGLATVAEGVESKEQLDFLRLLECESYQGYFFSRPLPPKEFEKRFIKK